MIEKREDYRVYCDTKNCINNFQTRNYVNCIAEQEAFEMFKEAGWVIVSDKNYCPRCYEEIYALKLCPT